MGANICIFVGLHSDPKKMNRLGIALLKWYDKNKRNLPWRTTKNPYKIWVSEIILQQTRVSFGLEYYQRFINQFPDIENLAFSDENEVLKQWQGLGYYSRARNMHSAAKDVYFNKNGRFPDNFQDLKKLKGIGKYTAAAIASICFNEKVPAMDGNAYRVYSRLFNIDKDISQIKNQNYFFDLAMETISENRPGDFNQAIMDLGSKICLPKNPTCLECPIIDNCLSHKMGNMNELPVKNKRIKVKKRDIHFMVFKSQKGIILQKNTNQGIWKNLYLFPYIELSSNQKFLTQIKNEYTYKNPILEQQITHLLTHQKLNIRFWVFDLNLEFKNDSSSANWQWFSYQEMKKLPIPKPIENFTNQYL